MRNFFALTVRSKLTLIGMATGCAALLVAAVAFSAYDDFSFRAGMLQDATSRAQLIAANSVAALESGNPASVNETLAAMGVDPHLVAAVVFDAAGREFARYVRPDAQPFITPKPADRALGFVGDHLEVSDSVHASGRRWGSVYVRSDLEELNLRRQRGVAIMGVVLGASLAVAFVVASLLQRWLVRPIRRLSEASRAVVRDKDYSVRVPREGRDEVGEFIDCFNEMLAEIQLREMALQAARAELEHRVAERTRELFSANERLTREAEENLRGRTESDNLRGQLEAAVEHLQREVEERADVQDALRRSEERFSKAFRASPVPLAILTRQSRAFVDVNNGFAALAGRRREEIIGRTLFDLLLWKAPETRRELEAVFTGSGPVRNRQCAIGDEEHPRTALLSAETLMLGSEPCVLLMVEDISDRMNLEAQLRQAQKMDAIGQLASGVAHDFNNLLTIIQGHTQVVLSTQPCTDKAREALAKVTTASQRAAQLTRQLLTFSRKNVVQLKTLDLNQAVANATLMLGPLLGESVQVRWKPGAGLPPVLADVGMLEQVIVNLAVNARDAMTLGGELILSTQCHEIDAGYVRLQSQARAGRFVSLQVSDTGCGMDAATLERIFEPFFTTKGIGKGTGLGLATVYAIAKQHQGWVEVSSQVGVGTTFKVFLPAAVTGAAPPDAGTDPGLVVGGNETILVVEDEALLRELVTQILREFGYTVIGATHGREAIRAWEGSAHKPELLLTDMVMPGGMTGSELAETLRGADPDLKVVYTSGYSTELIGRNLQTQDRANFLPKPYHPRTLAKVVRDCLDT